MAILAQFGHFCVPQWVPKYEFLSQKTLETRLFPQILQFFEIYGLYVLYWVIRPPSAATWDPPWDPPWDHPLGPPLGPHWDPPGTPLGHTWDHPGTTLVPHWDHTGHPMGPPLDPPGTPKRGAQTSAVVGLYGQYGLAAGP